MGRIEIVEEPAADGPRHMIGICEENLIDICDENVAVEAGEAAAIAADIEMHPTPGEPFSLASSKLSRKAKVQRQRLTKKRGRSPPPTRSAEEVDAEFRNLASRGISSPLQK